MKRFSIIVPALNEAGEINELIIHLRALQGGKDCQIIVVDGSAEKDTLKALTFDDVHVLSAPRGRARQMNAGAAVAVGDILVFLHVDTRLPADALTLIDTAMGDAVLVGGAFDLGIRSKNFIFRVIAAAASLRSRLTRIPYGDQAIFIRRSYFKQLMGYPDIPLMEDVALMRQIKKAGCRIHIIPKCVSTSPRRWEKEGIVHTTLRNWMLLGAYYSGTPPDKLEKYYQSGKDAYGA